jgi:HEAT repeat protein
MASPIAPRFRLSCPRAAILATSLSFLVTAGCVHPREPVRIDSHDTDAQVRAMKRAVRQHDPAAAPLLVDELDSEDPAVRFYAIEALQRITGDRLGYDYSEDRPEKRKAAVDRWRKWLETQPTADAGNDRG